MDSDVPFIQVTPNILGQVQNRTKKDIKDDLDVSNMTHKTTKEEISQSNNKKSVAKYSWLVIGLVVVIVILVISLISIILYNNSNNSKKDSLKNLEHKQFHKKELVDNLNSSNDYDINKPSEEPSKEELIKTLNMLKPIQDKFDKKDSKLHFNKKKSMLKKINDSNNEKSDGEKSDGEKSDGEIDKIDDKLANDFYEKITKQDNDLSDNE